MDPKSLQSQPPQRFSLVALLMMVFCSVLNAQVDFRVEVGEEEYVMGPAAAPMDNPLFTLQSPAGLLLFSANSNTLVYPQSGLQPLSSGPAPALKKGSVGTFDECGAWLQSAAPIAVGNGRSKNNPAFAGWYHAEEKCDYTNGVTLKSMAYADSVDGKTWRKPNYPYNRILTAAADVATDPQRNSVGDGRVIKVGEYYYLFYWASDNWGIHLARSRVADQGAPGTWWKFNNGSFSEPGVGGKSVPFSKSLLSTHIVFNTYLNRYIAMPVFGRWGFSLNQSSGTNIMSWGGFPDGSQPIIYPPVSYTTDERVDRGYARTASDKQYYNYASIVSPEGDSDSVGQVFYLYYIKLFDGENFDRRYQMRRKIKLYKGVTSQFLSRLTLASYENAAKRTLLSTETPRPGEGYVFTGRAGYLLPYPETNFVSVYQCYDPAGASYFLSTADPSKFGWTGCESTTDRFVRRIGYVSTVETPDASVPLVRCIENDGARSQSVDASCGGKRVDRTLGYVFGSSFGESSNQ